MASKGTTKIVRRNSEDGQFAKKSYVKAHPKTTETERVHVPPPKKPTKGK